MHFSLRAATIRHEDEAFTQHAPLAAAILFGLAAGIARMLYAQIYAGAFALSLLSSSAWVLERIMMTSAIDFMRSDFAFRNYGSDLELNCILVGIATIFSTGIGGTLGVAIRYVG